MSRDQARDILTTIFHQLRKIMLYPCAAYVEGRIGIQFRKDLISELISAEFAIAL